MRPLNLNWVVVLVRPRNPLNIGAAARALANFGMREMAVVAPFAPTWAEARSAAVGAESVIAAARATPTLNEAIGEAALVIGTTSGSRRHLDRELLPLSEFGAWLRHRRAKGTAALLFGSEKTGLGNEEMSHCHALVRIPTSSDCPSMNLGQAVAVCAYELARAGVVSISPPQVAAHQSQPANQQTLNHLLERAARLLDISGYLKPKSRAATLIKLRRFLLGLNLTCHDARVLGGVLTQLEWEIGRRKTVNGVR
jgi:tRNA/rRNA methyltransferase